MIKDEVDPVIPNAVGLMCDGDPDDVAPKITCEDSSMIPSPVMLVPVIPGDSGPRSGRHLLMVVGDFSVPVFLLGDPKRISLGVGELHTNGREVCPRCFCRVRVVEGILDSWIGSRPGGLVMRYMRCGPTRSRMCVPRQ